jgi:hypothetical protein
VFARGLRIVAVVPRLGLRSVVRVLWYRLLLHYGFYRRALPIEAVIRGPFFDAASTKGIAAPIEPAEGDEWVKQADRILAGESLTFSTNWVRTGFPPNWNQSVLNGHVLGAKPVHWTRIPDFDAEAGDVKGYWELGRFDAIVALALAYLCSKHARFLDGIEAMVSSFAASNPANQGVQWKCGQECSLRMMHFLLAAELIEYHAGVSATSAAHEFVSAHCARISRTMSYAIGQDNNHGTSEAVALFAAGEWLSKRAAPRLAAQGKRWCLEGRRWLEDRALCLILPDGSFSQHSVNYHRLMLDTYCFAEFWRQINGAAPFNTACIAKLKAAVAWLAAMVDANTGDAPNLGANDGARALNLTRCEYRDFRPTVQLASALFTGRCAYPAGLWDSALKWLRVARARGGDSCRHSQLFSDGGYATLACAKAWLLLRLPRFLFRPSHADALHVDLWVNGVNVLRDGGTYSYHTSAERLAFFGGTASHNTIQFDDRDQMPRLSRFLFGAWLKPQAIDFSATENLAGASYQDYQGASHRRSVKLGRDECTIIDHCKGFRSRAVMRWRLAPGRWVLTPTGARSANLTIVIASTVPTASLRLVDADESRRYAAIDSIPVLEVVIKQAAQVTTRISWSV